MRIVDCFQFYNELDILMVRLTELYDVVDAFVLVEATKTHSKGISKPLYYAENKHLFEKYNNKIIHVVTDFTENYSFAKDITNVNEHWFREIYQRECIRVGLGTMKLSPDDVIMICDVDEIPKRSTVAGFRNISLISRHKIQQNKVYSLVMTLYYYTIELTTPTKWYHAKVFKFGTIGRFKLLSGIRLSHYPGRVSNDLASIGESYKNEFIPNGGFHLSYFGGIDAIKTKVESFAESTDYADSAKDVDHLAKCQQSGIIHFNGESLIRIPLATNTDVPVFFMKRT